MKALTNIFNKFSYPKTISTQKTIMEGRHIRVLSDNITTKWNFIDYLVVIYAKRNLDNSYDIYLRRHSDLMDYGRTILHEKLSINKAIALLNRYDEQIGKLAKINLGIKRGKAKRHHYKNIQSKLTQSGIIKH